LLELEKKEFGSFTVEKLSTIIVKDPKNSFSTVFIKRYKINAAKKQILGKLVSSHYSTSRNAQ
jgi:hypothetical protein